MKLAPKFSLILVAVFGVMLVAAGIACYSYVQATARGEVLNQAQLMMEAAAAMRSYTDKQIKPLVGVRRTNEFHPQWVPAYSATQVFNYLRQKYPAYTYKEATLNPTNLADRAVDWEADVVDRFRNAPGLMQLTGERNTPDGRSMFLAHPIVVTASCLECHSTASAAPPQMVVQYGPNNGFGWRLNEIVGAQIVSVPAAVSSNLAQSAVHALVTALVCFALVALIFVNLVLTKLVIQPLGTLTAAAEDASAAGAATPDIPVRGRDEIAKLTAAFNRMRNRLAFGRPVR